MTLSKKELFAKLTEIEQESPDLFPDAMEILLNTALLGDQVSTILYRNVDSLEEKLGILDKHDIIGYSPGNKIFTTTEALRKLVFESFDGEGVTSMSEVE